MLDKIDDVKAFIIEWNNTFPLDRFYRKKYNIAFCSQQHLDVNQIDVFLDVLEDRMFDYYIAQHKQDKENLEAYKKGEIFNETISEEKVSELFDKIDIGMFNKKSEDS